MNPVFAFGMEGDEPGLESILESTLKHEVKLPPTRQQAISGLIKRRKAARKPGESTWKKGKLPG